MTALEVTREILRTNLGLGNRADSLGADTLLMGNIPEFDSMAVVSVVGAIEEQLDCAIEDEEIIGEIFETVGALANFVSTKM